MSFSIFNYEATGYTLELSGVPLYPFNTFLIWEHDTYGLMYVRHDDQTKIVITTDKGATDVVNIDLTGATAKKIQAGKIIGNDLWLVCCDNPDDEFTVLYIELDNSNNVVDVGDSAGADAGSVFVIGLFTIGSDVHVFNMEARSLTDMWVVWDVDTAPFVEKDTNNSASAANANTSRITVIGTKTYHHDYEQNIVINYESATTTISFISSTIQDAEVPVDKNLVALAYDGDDILYLTAKDTNDSLNYLYSFSVTDETYTKLGAFDIALMSDDNVRGTTPPFNLEKGFHISEDKIYQIPLTYNGKLNLISVFDFTGTIKSITDHYIIDSGGKIYEMIDLIGSILEGLIYYSRNYYPYLEMKFNSDNLTIVPQMFIQIIGTYTADDVVKL
ncbi:hypothetical protein LCGC14_1364910, partial [marine sediment metagenome]